MKKKITSLFVTALIGVLSLIFINTQNKAKANPSPVTATNIQVIQFHSAHRCITCNLIEKLSRETLKQSFPSVPFLLINVDDKKNQPIAESFEATGTALFLYNPVTKKKKDLTDFAFMNAKSKPEEFKKGLKKEIENFK